MNSSETSSDLRVAISGKSGCGNTTVSRLVAGRLGLRVINYTFKDMAREDGITFAELCARAEADSSYDRRLDRRQIELAAAGGCVLGSRLAVWHLRDTAFTVYLRAGLAVRAARIAGREGLTRDAAAAETSARDGRDRARYLRLYGWDVDVFGFVDLVVDAEVNDQNAAAEAIVRAVRAAVPKGRRGP